LRHENGIDDMNGRFFITLFLCVMACVILTLIVFNFYPPAGNSPVTLLVLAVAAVGAYLLARRMGGR